MDQAQALQRRFNQFDITIYPQPANIPHASYILLSLHFSKLK